MDIEHRAKRVSSFISSYHKALVTYYGAVAIKLLHSTFGTFMRRTIYECLENHRHNQNSVKVELLIE